MPGSRGPATELVTGLVTALLGVLACPWCAAPDLALQEASTHLELHCTVCGRSTEVRDGIWEAMGGHRPARTAAQLSNVVPPTPQLYERVWRVRSLSLLSGRSFPVAEELAELCAALRPGPGRPMVDVGCSEGLYARALAAAGSPVIAVDHSAAFLRRVRDRCAGEGLAVLAVRALAQHLPVAGHALAGVAIGGSLNEIGDQQAALDECGRVLAGDGRLFSMHLLRAHTFWGRVAQGLARPAGIAFPTLAGTHAMLGHAGLTAVAVRAEGVVCRVTAAPASG